MHKNTFNPARMNLARLRRGFSKTRLAAEIGKSPTVITKYEKSTEPPERVLDALSRALHFPRSFFFRDDEMVDVPLGGTSFRALARMPAAQRDAVMAVMEIAGEFNRLLSARINLPVLDVPFYDCDEDPETLARNLRMYWNIGDRPIKNMVHLLEAKGVRVFSMSELWKGRQDVDAVSTWIDDTPFVMLNTMKSGERSRFDAAHELGHLVMHRHGEPRGKHTEAQANHFAAAFLMPKSEVIYYGPRLPTPESILELKKRWKVAAVALLKRFKDIGCVARRHYEPLFIQMSKMGWRSREPQGCERETSSLIPKSLELLRESGRGTRWIAEQMQVYPEDLNEMLFGSLVFGMDGGRVQRQRRKGGIEKDSHLKLVKG